jgi:trehalose 6-phosphate synthase/phosphatase
MIRGALRARGSLTGPWRRTHAEEQVLIVANRLPLTVTRDGAEIRVEPSSGGLATGLSGVQRHYRSTWIGWTGFARVPDAGTRTEIDARLRDADAIGMHLTAEEIAGFYRRYSNGVLWPVLHDMNPLEHAPHAPHAAHASQTSDMSRDWSTYRAVNERYAAEVIRRLRPGDLVWVHDYHLMLVPRLVRERHPKARIGFFLHTPFPSVESFLALPHATALLDGILGADAIGVHIPRYASRLVEAMRTGLGIRATGTLEDRDGRRVAVFDAAMGVDAESLGAVARRLDVLALARQTRGQQTLLLGVDRLDYTKGIPEKLRAFDRLLERDPRLRGRVRLAQVAVPSRENVAGYDVLRREVEAAVERINGRWGDPGWQPVSYHYGSVDLTTLVALYRAADVMVVTSLADGMNLVAKEYVASRVDDDGVLVLSERAGAAAELRAALLVDPTDECGLATAYARAVSMPRAERHVRMRHLRLTVAEHDVHRWARGILVDLAERTDSAPRASLA